MKTSEEYQDIAISGSSRQKSDAINELLNFIYENREIMQCTKHALTNGITHNNVYVQSVVKNLESRYKDLPSYIQV